MGRKRPRRKDAWTRGALSLALALGFLLSPPAAAQTAPPPSAEALADYHRTCASEIANLTAERGNGSLIDAEYDVARFGRFPGATGGIFYGQGGVGVRQYPRLATADELRQSIPLVGATSREMFNPAFIPLARCAMRVAMRYAPGTAAAARPNAVASRPTTRPNAVASRPAPPRAAVPPSVDTASRDRANRLALFDAVSTGDVTRLRQMLDSGAATPASLVDERGNTPLHIAAGRCNEAMVRLLLSRGAANDVPNRSNDSPITFASVRCGEQSPLTQLIRQGGAGATGSGGSRVAAGGSPATSDPSRSRRILIHNPALDATSCVHVRPYGSPGSRGFTQSIVNQCGRVVEVSWCSTDGECERDSGNSWTLAASGQGSAYPVGRSPVLYVACFGRNSGGFERGSQGRRIVCTGDVGAH